MIQSTVSSEYDNIVFVDFVGDINSAAVHELDSIMEPVFEDKHPFVIVNLAETSTISGAVLGELLEWRSKFSQALNGDIVLCAVSAGIRTHLQDLGTDTVFNMFEDKEGAINFLNWEYQGLSENLIFTIPSDLAIVPALRNLVKKCVLGKGYSTREAFQIETIIDELCNNAIEHGNHGVEGVVEVALAIGRDKIEINIANGIEFINGEQSSPEAITRVMESFRDKPSSTIDNPRGRGLALVKMLASEFDIDSSDDGTCVHVTKYREA